MRTKMKSWLYVISMFGLFFCKGENNEPIKSINDNSIGSLIIIFNRYDVNTVEKSFTDNPNKNLYFKRENFPPPYEDPNLHISVFLENIQDTTFITRKQLDKMKVWFDSDMDYMDWFNLDFKEYYIIFQDEYLVNGSLNSDHTFSTFKVKIHTGGVE